MPIRIFIDQGHNPSGPNAGAEGNGLREQDVTYNVGIYLAELLNDDPRFTARTSRTTPTESLGTSNAGSLQSFFTHACTRYLRIGIDYARNGTVTHRIFFSKNMMNSHFRFAHGRMCQQ